MIAPTTTANLMTPADHDQSSVRRAIKGFLVGAFGLSAALLGLGAMVALIWGRAMMPAIAAGVGCGLLAAMIGAVPVIVWRHRTGADGVPIVLMAMVFRVVAALGLAIVCLQSSNFDPRPLVLSLVLTHAVLQVADFRLAKQLLFSVDPN